jgi:hypothetical protein
MHRVTHFKCVLFIDQTCDCRVSYQPCKAASQHSPDPGSGEGVVQGAEDQARDTQVWPHLPCQPDRTGAAQVQRKDRQGAGGQVLPVHSIRCSGRISRCPDRPGQQSQGQHFLTTFMGSRGSTNRTPFALPTHWQGHHNRTDISGQVLWNFINSPAHLKGGNPIKGEDEHVFVGFYHVYLAVKQPS